MDLYMAKMEADYGQLVDGLGAEFSKLLLYVDFRRAKKNEVLKATTKVESNSRYICSGIVGMYFESEDGPLLIQVYKETDVAYDSESYRNASVTNFYLKCLSDVVYYELSKSSELQLVLNHPKVMKLLLAINHRMLSRQTESARIKNLGVSKGYPEFIRSVPGIENLLTQADLATYFNCTPRTVRNALRKYNPQ